MKQKNTEQMTTFDKLRRQIGRNLSLIIVVVTAVVLEGGGLMQYYYLKREASDPRAGKIFVILLLIGLILVILLMTRAVKNMRKIHDITVNKEKMESELHIARGIQMSMLPKIFPPYPERGDVDMHASIVPAKEVGGDLYDFYIRDEKLFFCIGDVSGKGVPASLVMAVTRSLFRTITAHEKSPARIITEMNEAMSEMNESSMFVTLFVGTLDLTNGHMRYCNAGHNAPYLLGDSVTALPVASNLPLGVMTGAAFTEQETDLKCSEGIYMYTDGITEAENADKELFGEGRLIEVLSKGGADAETIMANVNNAVQRFVNGSPQSDDMTALLIRYTNDNPAHTAERHLILHNDIQQIPQLADFVETIAESTGIDQSMAMSLNLALEEAVSNVIMYAYPAGADGLVDIEAIIRQGQLDLIVSDSGDPFDPTKAPEADITLSAEERPIGGLGIHMVRTIMDTVNYERSEGKNILTMTKKI